MVFSSAVPNQEPDFLTVSFFCLNQPRWQTQGASNYLTNFGSVFYWTAVCCPWRPNCAATFAWLSSVCSSVLCCQGGLSEWPARVYSGLSRLLGAWLLGLILQFRSLDRQFSSYSLSVFSALLPWEWQPSLRVVVWSRRTFCFNPLFDEVVFIVCSVIFTVYLTKLSSQH